METIKAEQLVEVFSKEDMSEESKLLFATLLIRGRASNGELALVTNSKHIGELLRRITEFDFLTRMTDEHIEISFKPSEGCVFLLALLELKQFLDDDDEESEAISDEVREAELSRQIVINENK